MPLKTQSYLDWLDDLESQTSQTTAATQSEERRCCVYAVPGTLINTNGRDEYRPRVVSIGPLHARDDQVQVIKKHKLEFLKRLLSRKELPFNDLIASISQRATEAIECYSRENNLLRFRGDRFPRMMVLDGCFLLELFLNADQILSELNNLAGAVPYIYRDLLLLENQIPFSFLENLFQTLNYMPEDTNDSLSLLALRFFNREMRRPDRVIEKFLKRERETPLHLLDLVRSSFIPMHDPEPPKNNEAVCRLIDSIPMLRHAGIKFKERKAESFLEVKFGKGAIQMPKIIIDYTMKTFLLNCVAFEELHDGLSKHFTVYATFLDCLVGTALDVSLLCESNIVDSYFGKYDDVVQFINKMAKGLVFDDDQFYLSHVFKDVNDHLQSDWDWAKFKNRYFEAPWSFISASAGSVLLVLTMAQTFYTIYAYYVPKL
jgi:hypothetical protein